MKKTPSKVAHNRPQIFLSTGLAAQTSPELIFHIINMSQNSLSTDLCPEHAPAKVVRKVTKLKTTRPEHAPQNTPHKIPLET